MYNKEVTEKDFFNLYVENKFKYVDEFGRFTHLSFVLGNKLNIFRKPNLNNELAYAEVFKLRFNIRNNSEDQNPIVRSWEHEFLKYIKNLKTNYTTFTYSATSSLEDEINNNITWDMVLIITTFMLITLFATLFMSLNKNKVTSPGIVLPNAGILSAMFGVTSSMGFLSILGFKACSLVFIIPFLVIGS